MEYYQKNESYRELIGLLTSMMIFAIFLTRIEPDIATYGDGLWYTFAVVTTIGFGDIFVVTAIGRVLSVILGLYGLFIIAIITSVVVNYYQTHQNESD